MEKFCDVIRFIFLYFLLIECANYAYLCIFKARKMKTAIHVLSKCEKKIKVRIVSVSG